MARVTAGDGGTDTRPEHPRAAGGRWRRFTLLWSSGAFSSLGTMTFTLAVPLLALAETGSAAVTAWITAAGMLPRVLLHVPAGVLLDRVDPRRVLLLAQAGRLTVTAVFVAPVLLWDAPVMLLAAATALHGACSALFLSAVSTAVPCLVPQEELATAAGRNEARSHGTQLAGRPLGGFLYGVAGWLPALFDAAMSLCALVSTLLLPRPIRPRTGKRDRSPLPSVREVSEGFRRVCRDRLLATVLVVCTVTNALFQTVWLIIMLVATESGLSPLLLGCVLAATGVGGLLGSLLAPPLVSRTPSAVMVALCLWLWMIPLGALALAHHSGSHWMLLVLPLTWGGIGFVGAHMNVTAATHQAARVPREVLGRVLSANRFFAHGALPVGLVCGGHVLEAAGPAATSAFVLTAVGLLAVVVTVLLPRLRERPASRSTARPSDGAALRPTPS
ncbi:MFS transporter [Nocardiopsis algeriensis]|uniref:MFS family permease n=1 Tax=Nocardiopsis algeriensis TaxID=1478215 RepID=A0A841IN37_9ACTN|nr:MFS transporter [Nocardiopsis algeriensis]MBB6120157.1 MFS family permease [Nocardiopsis algeriensis]